MKKIRILYLYNFSTNTFFNSGYFGSCPDKFNHIIIRPASSNIQAGLMQAVIKVIYMRNIIIPIKSISGDLYILDAHI